MNIIRITASVLALTFMVSCDYVYEYTYEVQNDSDSEVIVELETYRIDSLVNDELLLTDTFKGILFGNSDSQNWKDIRNSGRIVGYVGGDTRGWSAKIGFYFLKEKTYGVIITSNFDNMAHKLDLQ